MTVSESKTPSWMRILQIVLGGIAIILASIALFFPAFAFISVVYISAIVLLVVGIERILVGIFSRSPGSSRWGNIGLGILVLIISGIVLAFPLSSALFVVILLAVALLFDGIARIVHGVGDKSIGKGSRAFAIIAGIIEIGMSILIFASPLLGAAIAGIFISIALLIVGIQIVVAGATGSRISYPDLR
ncbi:MAG TPA: DUF308 domain-containing protein [Candidatus Nitrosocosmicus sp.]|nr:DUF308 domain-containing protein [Candidatus Nitrosocosmicus sp.]